MRSHRDFIKQELAADKKLMSEMLRRAGETLDEGDWRTATLMVRDIWAALENERKQLGEL